MQAAWSTYENPDIKEDPEELDEYPEPNPKELPPPPAEPKEGEENPDE